VSRWPRRQFGPFAGVDGRFGLNSIVAGSATESVPPISVLDVGSHHLFMRQVPRLRTKVAPLALLAMCAAGLSAARPAVAAQIPTSWSDFDGDGFRDLVIGAPNATVTRSGVDHPGAGAVYVIYGTANGPSATRVHVWTQDSAEGLDVIGDFSEDNDHFGAAVAAGDFNNDGAGDLAIGIPGEDRTYTAGEPLNKHVDAGGVEIIFGKNGVGLTARNDITSFPIQDDQNNSPSSKYDGSHWGAALATVDMLFGFGGYGSDGIADLVVGAPDYDGGRGAVEGISGNDIIHRRAGRERRWQPHGGALRAVRNGNRAEWPEQPRTDPEHERDSRLSRGF
jgi:hypothetical protein